LAWKVLYDFLSASGVVLETVTPASTVRAAFAASLIDNSKVWLAALDARNKMAHSYDIKLFEKVIDQVGADYLTAFGNLKSTLDRLAQEAP
jgi:nucleotidyltransferase substrate binding protein (TIGR01987 family)